MTRQRQSLAEIASGNKDGRHDPEWRRVPIMQLGCPVGIRRHCGDANLTALLHRGVELNLTHISPSVKQRWPTWEPSLRDPEHRDGRPVADCGIAAEHESQLKS